MHCKTTAPRSRFRCLQNQECRVAVVAAALRSAFFGFEHLHRLARHDGRDRVLVDELRVPVTTKKNAEVIEGCNNTRQFNTVDEKYCQRDLLLANCVQEKICLLYTSDAADE